MKIRVNDATGRIESWGVEVHDGDGGTAHTVADLPDDFDRWAALGKYELVDGDVVEVVGWEPPTQLDDPSAVQRAAALEQELAEMRAAHSAQLADRDEVMGELLGMILDLQMAVM